MEWTVLWNPLLRGIRKRLSVAYALLRTEDGAFFYNGLHKYRRFVEDFLRQETQPREGIHFLSFENEFLFARVELLGSSLVCVTGGPLKEGEPPPVKGLLPFERQLLVKAQKLRTHILQVLFFRFPLGVVFLSFGEGRVLFWNSTMEVLTGRREAEVLGKKWDELFPMEHMEDMWQSLRFGEEYFIRNFHLKRGTNGDRLLNFRFFPWREGNGPFQVVGLVEDVTDRARWGESIRQMERLSSIGRFISSMAHEINNPLGVIYGYAQMLLSQVEERSKDCPACQMTRRVLEKIEKEAAHCSEVIRYLVDFSKPLVLEREPTDVNALLRESISLVDFFCRENEKVEFAFEENLPLVYVDRTRMRQVFMNLAKNAFEAMQEKGGVLRISTESVILENLPPWEKRKFATYVKVVFADTGKGIPESVLSRIFEPFFTTKERGTGLGLSISYSIVRAHGGWIEIASKEGVGTKVQVFLPVERGSGK